MGERQKIQFPAGKMGINYEFSTGKITKIFDGWEAKRVGVKIGWRIVEVNGTAYTKLLYDQTISAGKPYNITFETQEERGWCIAAFKGHAHKQRHDAELPAASAHITNSQIVQPRGSAALVVS